MKIRFPVIWRDSEELNDEEQNQYKAFNRIPEGIVEKGEAVIDLDRVESWHALQDNNSTLVHLQSGTEYEIDIKEDIFSELYGKMALSIIGEIYIEKEKNDEDNDEDSI